MTEAEKSRFANMADDEKITALVVTALMETGAIANDRDRQRMIKVALNLYRTEMVHSFISFVLNVEDQDARDVLLAAMIESQHRRTTTRVTFVAAAEELLNWGKPLQ